jgi:hypothetical protein
VQPLIELGLYRLWLAQIFVFKNTTKLHINLFFSQKFINTLITKLIIVWADPTCLIQKFAQQNPNINFVPSFRRCKENQFLNYHTLSR